MSSRIASNLFLPGGAKRRHASEQQWLEMLQRTSRGLAIGHVGVRRPAILAASTASACPHHTPLGCRGTSIEGFTTWSGSSGDISENLTAKMDDMGQDRLQTGGSLP